MAASHHQASAASLVEVVEGTPGRQPGAQKVLSKDMCCAFNNEPQGFNESLWNSMGLVTDVL